MKKTYFTKYLPVEGEIKEGDKFLLLNPHIEGQLRTCYWISKDVDAWSERDQAWTDKQDALYINPKESEYCGFVYRNEAFKAKLFLCSRDIQVGDEFTCIFKHHLYKCIAEDIIGEEIIPKTVSMRGAKCPLKDSFKVIGEVSPEAVWVKEGMEFDEEDLHIRTYYIPLKTKRWAEEGQEYTAWDDDPNDLEVNLHVLMYNAESGSQYVKRENLRKRIEIEFQCPTCKTFH